MSPVRCRSTSLAWPGRPAPRSRSVRCICVSMAPGSTISTVQVRLAASLTQRMNASAPAFVAQYVAQPG